MIELRTLGSLDLRHATDDRVIASVLAQPKRVALLCYLAVGPEAGFRRRNTLLATFWPEHPEDRARRALNQALYVLRRGLGPGVVVSRGPEEVGVNPAKLWCDAAALDERLEAGTSEEALELYRGPFLEGFHLAGTPRFERWQHLQRRRLEKRVAGAARKLSLALEAEGDAEGALRWARQAVVCQPLEEAAVLRVMELLRARDERALALEAYRRLADRLQAELGIRPGEEIRGLVEALRSEPGPNEETTVAGGGRSEPDAPPAGSSPEASGRPSSAVVLGGVPLLSRWRLRRLVPASVVGILLLVVITLITPARRERPPPAEAAVAPIKSVAVFPFENLGEERDEALAAGLSDDVEAQLVRIDDAKVVATAAVRRYRTDERSLEELASLLGVKTFLQGSVRRDGDRLRVVAKLVEARTGQTIWAERYDRRLEDLFEVQADIARRVAGSLDVHIDPATPSGAKAGSPEAVTAWWLAQRAKDLYTRSNRPQDMDEARRLLDRALAVDSTSVEALARLVQLYQDYHTHVGATEGAVWADSAWRAARRALDIAPEDPTALAAVTIAHGIAGDRRRQIAALHRFLQLAPGSQWGFRALANAYQHSGRSDLVALLFEAAFVRDPDWVMGLFNRGYYAWILGAYDRAFQAYRRLLSIDPSVHQARARFAEVHLTVGRLDSARHHIREVLRQEPDNARAHGTAGLIELYAGDYEAAVEWLEPLLERDPPVILIMYTGVVVPTAAGFARLEMGQPARAEEHFERSEAWYERAGPGFAHNPYDRVRLAAIRGQVDEALAILEEMADEGRWPFYYTYMGETDPMLESLRGHPRFQETMTAFRERMDRQRERVLSYSLPISEEDVQRLLEEVGRDVAGVDYLPD